MSDPYEYERKQHDRSMLLSAAYLVLDEYQKTRYIGTNTAGLDAFQRWLKAECDKARLKTQLYPTPPRKRHGLRVHPLADTVSVSVLIARRKP